MLCHRNKLGSTTSEEGWDASTTSDGGWVRVLIVPEAGRGSASGASGSDASTTLGTGVMLEGGWAASTTLQRGRWRGDHATAMTRCVYHDGGRNKLECANHTRDGYRGSIGHLKNRNGCADHRNRNRGCADHHWNKVRGLWVQAPERDQKPLGQRWDVWAAGTGVLAAAEVGGMAEAETEASEAQAEVAASAASGTTTDFRDQGFLHVLLLLEVLQCQSSDPKWFVLLRLATKPYDSFLCPLKSKYLAYSYQVTIRDLPSTT